MATSNVARGAVSAAVLLVIYEAIAIFTDVVPTITEILEDSPEWLELTVIGGLMVWLAYHFGWLKKGE